MSLELPVATEPPVPVEARLFGRRTMLIVTASVAYVAAAAIHAAGGRSFGAWALAALGLAVAAEGARREPLIAIAAWGLGIATAAGGAPEGSWASTCALAGALAAAVAGRMAIARVSAPEGLARKEAERGKRRALLGMLLSLAGIGAMGALAIGLRVAASLGAHGWWAEHARGVEWVASLLVGGVLVEEAVRCAEERKLELGVLGRLHAAAALGLIAASLAWAAWFVGAARSDAMARIAVGTAALLACTTSLRGDAVRIERASRRVVALVVVGGPIIMLGAGVAAGRPHDAIGAVAITAGVALAIGAAARWIEEPLRPERGAWLDAVKRAHDALFRTDADEAIREALVALRAPAGHAAASPELWTFDPPRCTTVDRGGYAHEAHDGSVPPELLTLASREPEAIVRLEVLDALQVRQSELRPIARWLDDRGAMLAVVVTRAGEAEGLLVLPRGNRHAPLSLEEARTIKRFADSLAALCHAKSALARSMAREREATLREEAATLERAKLEAREASHEERHALALDRLSRGAAGGYAGASRMAIESLERRARTATTLAVVAPSGVDAAPFLARAHLAGARARGPFVVVDGTASREHDVARWSDATTSPVNVARQGWLVLLDAAALPLEVQRLIARALLTTPDGAVALAIVTSIIPSELVATGKLDPQLASALADAAEAPIVLPRLRDRPEDLRAILSDRLAREGLRARGIPVGLDDAAFARLLDHPFEGEDAELQGIVVRLVAGSSGPVIRASDVDALGLPGAAPASGAAGVRVEGSRSARTGKAS